MLASPLGKLHCKVNLQSRCSRRLCISPHASATTGSTVAGGKRASKQPGEYHCRMCVCMPQLNSSLAARCVSSIIMHVHISHLGVPTSLCTRMYGAGFPFTRIQGQEEMKLALLLNVVDPNIGGALIMGDRGCGKSVAVSSTSNTANAASSRCKHDGTNYRKSPRPTHACSHLRTRTHAHTHLHTLTNACTRTRTH